MHETTIKKQEDLVRKYIRAKDTNMPALMKEVFSSNARLEMKLQTQNISFPSFTLGLENITEVLVTTFAKSYEKVYTFCLSDSLKNNEETLTCHWIVCMREKNSGKVRIGYGIYDWVFTIGENTKVKHLIITIEEMFSLEKKHSSVFLEWLEGLSYPFCSIETFFKNSPKMEEVQSIENYFRKVETKKQETI
ncbi:MAG: hypothetical protein HRT41_06390 [Campylobacteraceae bacterium]|nr:hypothetical protein [Campylobacteraceae bacterium]